MARTIIAIPQLYTDGIGEIGVVRDVSLHMEIVFDDGSKEWHYYGTVPPVPPPTGTVVAHPSVRFPSDFLNLQTGVNAILYDLGLTVARSLLEL